MTDRDVYVRDANDTLMLAQQVGWWCVGVLEDMEHPCNLSGRKPLYILRSIEGEQEVRRDDR